MTWDAAPFRDDDSLRRVSDEMRANLARARANRIYADILSSDPVRTHGLATTAQRSAAFLVMCHVIRKARGL
jgi:hypothetical protein